jgi:hypothetical protein
VSATIRTRESLRGCLVTVVFGRNGGDVLGEIPYLRAGELAEERGHVAGPLRHAFDHLGEVRVALVKVWPRRAHRLGSQQRVAIAAARLPKDDFACCGISLLGNLRHGRRRPAAVNDWLYSILVVAGHDPTSPDDNEQSSQHSQCRHRADDADEPERGGSTPPPREPIGVLPASAEQENEANGHGNRRHKDKKENEEEFFQRVFDGQHGYAAYPPPRARKPTTPVSCTSAPSVAVSSSRFAASAPLRETRRIGLPGTELTRRRGFVHEAGGYSVAMLGAVPGAYRGTLAAGAVLAALVFCGCASDDSASDAPTDPGAGVTFPLAALNDSDLDGATVVLTPLGSKRVRIEVDGITRASPYGGGPHRIELVRGACDDPGDLAGDLGAVRDEGGGGELELGLPELIDGEYAVTVRFVKGSDDTLIACGDVPDSVEVSG